jgi:small-conductance mechanosensitive channel
MDAVRLSVAILTLVVSSSLAPLPSSAQSWPAEQASSSSASTPASDELDALIRTLEDPVARDKLIEQLKTLQQEQQTDAADGEEPPVQIALEEILKSLSERLGLIASTLLEVIKSLEKLPQIFDWTIQQLSEPTTQTLWKEVLTNLALAVAVGYLSFWTMRLILWRPKRKMAARAPKTRAKRLGILFLALLMDSFAIVVFLGGSYSTLGILEPRKQTRIVALAWILAFASYQFVATISRFVFAADSASLRLFPISDETAQYAGIWLRRLAFVPIYGYMALQAAVSLGLPAYLYETLLYFLGLIVSALIIILFVQNRMPVARLIRGPDYAVKHSPLKAFRTSIANIWYLVASGYVLLLYAIWVLKIPHGFQFVVKATGWTLGLLLAARFALSLLEIFFHKGIRLSERLRARFPGLEARANRYLPLLHTALRWLIYAVIVLALLEAWGYEAFSSLMSKPAQIIGSTAASILLIALASVIIWAIGSSLIDRQLIAKETDDYSQEPTARTKTLLSVARNALFAVIGVVSSLLVLSELGINIAPLLAGAGVVGLAVGFGAQTLVKDIITGAIILFQDLMAVGEVVKVGDTAGLVEAISIRHVRLRDLAGIVHTIPFSSITTISNLTKDFSYYVFDIGIAYREDVDEVMNILREIGNELHQDPEFAPLILEPLEIFGLDRFADSAVVIKARIKTQPIKQWTVGREFHRRLKRRFDELGIEIPFPHRTLYFGTDRNGEAPSGHVQIDSRTSERGSSPPEFASHGAFDMTLSSYHRPGNPEML